MIKVVLLGLSLVMCGYWLGYLVGYRHCFEFLKEELRKHMEE